jgi:glycosyltransferase involved in cell wall biosynthesis
MKKKSVLISIDWFLPGTKSGGPVRSYANLIDHLKDDFDFYVLTRDTDYCESEPYSNIAPNTWNQYQPGLKVYYLSKEHTSLKGINQLLRLQTFDIVMINGLYSWYFSILPLWILRHHKQVIISARGMLNKQAFSVKPFKKKLFLNIARLSGLYNEKTFHATNRAEAENIKKWIGTNTTVKIAPNLPRCVAQKIDFKPIEKPVKFINIARVAEEKGTLKMLQALGKCRYTCLLDIYGPIYDDTYWKHCLKLIKKMPSHVQVSYRGNAASEDIPEILSRFHFLILLSEGENFGHSILEALSAGLPVIISDNTHWRQLEKHQIGWDLPLSESDQIVSALNTAAQMSNDEYQKMSQKAFDYARVFIENPENLELNKGLFLF